MTGELAASVGALPPMWVDDALQVVLLVLVAAGASAVALCRQPVRQVVLLSFYGIVLAVMFLALQAPDVTLSELTVGAVVLPLLLLLTLSKINQRGRQTERAGSVAPTGPGSHAREVGRPGAERRGKGLRTGPERRR